MHVDTDTIYRDTITVLNKLDARDATLKQDAWYKTVLQDCMWTELVTRSVGADGTVNIGSSFRIQIPEKNNYLPYKQWITPANRDSYFTVSLGDYVILGEVSEEITPETLREIVKKYEPQACQVKSFRDLTNSGIHSSTQGLMRFAEILSIEGA